MEDYIHYLRAMIGHSKALSVGLTALIINEKQEVLLEKRSDNGLYCFPGGGLDYEEHVLAGVRRELREETGLDVNSWSLFMILSGKGTTITYPNSDITNYVDLVFFATIDSHKAKLAPQDNESTSVFFCPLNALPPLEQFLPGTAPVIAKLKRGDFSLVID